MRQAVRTRRGVGLRAQGWQKSGEMGVWREGWGDRLSVAPAAVLSLQLCNTSASPYMGEIGVNGTIHTSFFIINGDVCVNIFSSAWL
jgi:hypothetical protein